MRLLDEGVERAVRLSSMRVGVALVYHTVARTPGDPARELVAAHGEALLEAQLRFVADRFRAVRASELLVAAVRRRRGDPIPVAITFDDDSPSHVSLAAPTLRRLGLPATFFLNGASLEAPLSYWWERLQRASDADVPGLAELAGIDPATHPTIHELGEAIEAMRRAERDRVSERLLDLAGPDPSDAGLRREQVRHLCDSGFEVAFHTRRHDRLPDLSDADLEAALSVGRVDLTAASGTDTTVIAYPHGRADARVVSAARAAGFTLGYTDRPKAVRTKSEPLLLGRVVPSPYSLQHLGSQIAKTLVRGLKPSVWA